MEKYRKIVSMDGFVSEKVDILANGMVGDIDSFGKYYISDKIKQELLALKKVKKSVYNNSAICVCNELGFGEMVFEIKYDKKTTDGLAISRLYLHENVYKINGYYINTIRTLIAEYKAPVDDYLDKSFEYFNVVLDDSADEYERDKYKYLIAKKHYSAAVFKKISERLNVMFDKFIKLKIKCLKDLNSAFSSAVIDTYNNEKKSIEERFLDENQDVVAYNELLDKAVEDKYGTSPEFMAGGDQYFEAITPITENLAKDYIELEDKGKGEVLKSLPREDSKLIGELAEEIKAKTKGGSKKYGLVLEEPTTETSTSKTDSANISRMRDKIGNISKNIAKNISTASNNEANVANTKPTSSEQKTGEVKTNNDGYIAEEELER